ncbi:MAG: ABC transporter substrate-binding protein [Nitriliruptorales bacterium]
MWLLVVVLAAAAGACGGDDAPEDAAEEPATEETAAEEPPAEPVTIRMGWGIPAEEIKYVMIATPEVAPNLGTWYEVDWNQFAGTALGVQGLAAGTLDCATVGGLSSANGIDQGADIVLTGEFIEERSPENFSTQWMVLEDSGIETLEDLRDKTVATSAIGGSTDYLQDVYIEQQAGLVPGEDYRKIEVPFSQQKEALLAGRIDMGLYPQPFWGSLTADADAKTMFSVTDVINPFVQLLNGCRRDFIEENPVVMEKFLEDWVTVSDFILDPANRDAVIQASADATQLPAEILEQYLLTDQDYFRPENGAISIDALQNEWDFFKEVGGIEGDLQVEDHIIPEYLPPGSE